jgi:hypothetical protein
VTAIMLRLRQGGRAGADAGECAVVGSGEGTVVGAVSCLRVADGAPMTFISTPSVKSSAQLLAFCM